MGQIKENICRFGMLWQSANISLQWGVIDIIISSKWHITQEIVINHQNGSDRGNRLD